jgi:DNA ligase-associated metallophosphoesterase
MNTHAFTLSSTRLLALPSGALLDPAEGLLCVSDLHLGKSDRIARRQGLMLPPYETRATLDRLATDLAATGARRVICLGDSFDDPAAADSLTAAERDTILRLQAGRDWIWIAGNHDPGPVDLGGSHRDEIAIGGLTYRHQTIPGTTAEVSGHYHPKLALPGAGAAHACFLFDADRLILPAYGAYTGGLSATDPALRSLLSPRAHAILTGRRPILAPLPPAHGTRGRAAPARRLPGGGRT